MLSRIVKYPINFHSFHFHHSSQNSFVSSNNTRSISFAANAALLCFKSSSSVVTSAQRTRASGNLKNLMVNNEKKKRNISTSSSATATGTTGSAATIKDSGKQLSKLQVEAEEVRSLLRNRDLYFDEKMIRFSTINSASALDELVRNIMSSPQKVCAVSIETDGTEDDDIFVTKIVGISLCYDKGSSWYIPVGHNPHPRNVSQLDLSNVLVSLRPLFESSEIIKVAKSLKRETSLLRLMYGYPSKSIDLKGMHGDIMLASYVLSPGDEEEFSALVEKHFSHSLHSGKTLKHFLGKGKYALKSLGDLDTEFGKEYYAESIFFVYCLWSILVSKLKSIPPPSNLPKNATLLSVYENIEIPLVDILSRMELEGILIDTEYLESLAKKFEERESAILNSFFSEAKRKLFEKEIEKKPVLTDIKNFNINSPKQLQTLLFQDLGFNISPGKKKGAAAAMLQSASGTDAATLKDLSKTTDLAKYILEHREISKLVGTYIEPLLSKRNKKTGKIHPSFNQTVTATGRLSCSNPNMQNIPARSERGKELRRGFIASPGRILFAVDYSQIELRILAEMSRDPVLVESFSSNDDVHKRTASQLFNVPIDKVTGNQRSVAKAINFGLIYGKTAQGLAAELNITLTEAKNFIKTYFEKYKAVKVFLDSQIRSAYDNECVYTMIGRRRSLPIKSTTERSQARKGMERMAMNTPIQGSAADLMKIAMIHIDRKLTNGNFKSKMVLQIHDEVVLDVYLDEKDAVEKLVVDAMENAMKLSIPLSVNVGFGSNLAEL